MASSSEPTDPHIYIPLTTRQGFEPGGSPSRAVAIHYSDFKDSRAEIGAVEEKMRQAGVNLVALSAGRVEWNYFRWEGHTQSWANDVTSSGHDFLAEDSARFSPWAEVNAVVDVLSPGYLKQHPEKAAISCLGTPSSLLVGTMELVDGEYGQLLLEMIEYIAAHYPQVKSISLTELSYRVDGYGPQEKTAFLAYTGLKDWPRNSSGQINIDDLVIGNWRTYELSRYLSRVAAAVHRYGKEFYMDVSVSLDNLAKATNENGTRYDAMLAFCDRLVVWGYFDLDQLPPEYLYQVASFLRRYPEGRTILSVGLWAHSGGTVTAEAMQRAILSSEDGGIPDIWITPGMMMLPEHWQVLDQIWGK